MSFKLEKGEKIRVKKFKAKYFAYARKTFQGRQQERYLGRCDEKGKPDNNYFQYRYPYSRPYRGRPYQD